MCSKGYWSGGWLSLSNCSITSLLPLLGPRSSLRLVLTLIALGIHLSLEDGRTHPWPLPLFTIRECSSSYCDPQDMFFPFLFNRVWIVSALLPAAYMCLVSAEDSYGWTWKLPGLLRWNGEKKYFVTMANSHNFPRRFCFSKEVQFFQLVAVSNARQASHFPMWFFFSFIFQKKNGIAM